MEESIYDLVVNILLERQRLVREELTKRFKKTRPFRMEPKSREEALYEANEMSPDIEQMLRQGFGNEAVDVYKAKLTKGAK